MKLDGIVRQITTKALGAPVLRSGEHSLVSAHVPKTAGDVLPRPGSPRPVPWEWNVHNPENHGLYTWQIQERVDRRAANIAYEQQMKVDSLRAAQLALIEAQTRAANAIADAASRR